MENRIARFLFGHFKENGIGDSVTTTSTQNLVAALMEINGLFLESKNVLRTHIVSVYAADEDDTVNMDQVYTLNTQSLALRTYD
jgi:hypothetical protein